MTQNPEDDDLDETLRRIRAEFGTRGHEEQSWSSSQSQSSQPLYGDARPIPSPQRARLRIPTAHPRVVWLLLGLNIVIYGWVAILSGNLITPDLIILQMHGWKQNDFIQQGEYWRLLTAMFLHGNVVHLFFNGYALYVLGPEVERIYGTIRFLTIYVMAGLVGNITSYTFSAMPSVGASGAIFGLIGGLAMFYYISRRILGEFGRSQLQGIISIIAINLVLGITMSGIDNFAHIGGLIGGALIGWCLAPRYEVDEQLFPPVLIQHYMAWGWVVVAGILTLLVLLTTLIQPPL